MIETGDVRLNVVAEGDGPAVVLLHGFPDAIRLWRHQIPWLVAHGYRVVAYDQRGFGDSEAPPGRQAYRLGKACDDAVAVLDSLGIERAAFVGHDFGAAVGWMLAMREPQRMTGLVALSVGHLAAYRRAGLRQALLAWYAMAFQVPVLPELALGLMPRKLLRKAARYPDAELALAELSRPGRRTAALNWYRANWRMLVSGRFPSVSVPVLGIWSSRDPALTEWQMTASRQYVTGSWRYERLEGVGHWIPLEAPERLNELLADWLAGSSGITAPC